MLLSFAQLQLKLQRKTGKRLTKIFDFEKDNKKKIAVSSIINNTNYNEEKKKIHHIKSHLTKLLKLNLMKLN